MGQPTLVTPNGHRAPVGTSFTPPLAGSAFFGWATPAGPSTVRIDAVKAIVPQIHVPLGQDGRPTGQQPIPTGNYLILVDGLPAPVPCPQEDAFNLMRILGWKIPQDGA